MITIMIIAVIQHVKFIFSFQMSLTHRIFVFHFKLFVDDVEMGGLNQIKTLAENKNKKKKQN